jgi:hypothetical protein
MLTYPQLGTGALSQFPIRTERRARTVMNAASGRKFDQTGGRGGSDDGVGA